MAIETKSRLNHDIKPRGTSSAYVEAPFDEAKAELENQGFEIISLPKNAQLRIQEGSRAEVSRHGNYTKEGFIYVPQKGVFLVKHSPVLDEPEKATNIHRNGEEFYPTKEQTEKALENSIQIPYNQEPIPTNRFNEDQIANSAFEENAKPYGDFLGSEEVGITEMPIWLVSEDYVNDQEKPFARQLWFHGLGVRSGLDGVGRYLNYDNRLRGVREVAEGDAPKNSGLYSRNEISKALKKQDFQE